MSISRKAGDTMGQRFCCTIYVMEELTELNKCFAWEEWKLGNDYDVKEGT